jgi:intracellular sulfur oxidation DsrE/DsrF family protein
MLLKQGVQIKECAVSMSAHGWSNEDLLLGVNPVRNSSGAINPAGFILKPNPGAEQRGIFSNGVKVNTGAVGRIIQLIQEGYVQIQP